MVLRDVGLTAWKHQQDQSHLVASEPYAVQLGQSAVRTVPQGLKQLNATVGCLRIIVSPQQTLGFGV